MHFFLMLLGHTVLTHLLWTLVNNLACDFQTDGIFKTKLGWQCPIPTKPKGTGCLKHVASFHQAGLLSMQVPSLLDFLLLDAPKKDGSNEPVTKVPGPETTLKILRDVKSRRLMMMFLVSPFDCYQITFSCSVVLLFCD